MDTVEVMFKSVEAVKDFVNIVNKYNFKVDLTSEKYTVDPHSIMGVFSLDLTKKIKLQMHDAQKSDSEKFMEEIKPYLSS